MNGVQRPNWFDWENGDRPLHCLYFETHEVAMP